MKKKYLLTLFVTVMLGVANGQAQCLDQAVSPVTTSIICGGSGTIGLASSEAGVNYYVRNDATSVTVTGPVAGTGGTLLLGTGHMTASTIYNVYARQATGGLAFDGIDDYVAIGTPLNSNNNFSWEVWIKTNTDGTIFSKAAATGSWVSGSKSLYIRNGKVTFEVFGAGYAETYNTYNDNNWHHVTVTGEMNYLGGPNDRVRIYVDGQFLIEKNNWDIQANSETGLINEIGFTNSNFPVTPYFTGIMDDFKGWTTVRTATDIATDMSSCLTGTETGLAAYYTFENGTGTTLTDIAGADNTGTLTNMSSSAWVYGRDDCGSCNIELTQKPVFVITSIADQTLTPETLTLCSTASTSILADSSEPGVNYYLRDNSTYNIISGPYVGTGGTLGLSTGFVVNTTTYNVIANKISGALSFDGIDDYVTVNESAIIENLGMAPFTMESWINPNTTTGVKSIIRKDGDYNLYLNNGNVVAEAFPSGGNGGSLVQAATTATVAPGRWTHVAAVWNGTTFAMYINGITATVSASSLSSSITSKFCIGGSKPLGQVFDGKIDEVRLWNTARTVSQLTANIGSCLTGTETGMLAYYPFEDGKGSSVLTDITANANNGTLSNMDDVQAWRGGVDNCGCSMMLSELPVVTVNSSPTVSVNSGSICSGNSFTITPSGASSYTITGGNFTVSPGATTSYSVTGSNTAGCVSLPAVSAITVNASPTLAVNSMSICSGNSVVLTPGGADTYSISGGTFTVTPTTTTSYSITGASTMGCAGTNTAVATITVNTTPTVTVNSASVCSGSSVAIVPSGADTYTISGGNFTVTPPVGVSAYSVTGTSTNGCQSAGMAVSSVTVNATPTISVNNATICSGNSVVITPTGAASYSITGGTFTVMPATTASYSVTGTSTAGCASNLVVSTISISATPTVAVSSGSVCSGGTFTLQPSGANSYTVTGNNFIVTPSVTTSYSVTGSNGFCLSGNTAVATVTVNVTPTLSVNSATICSGNSVAIAPSGASTYTISGNNFTVSPLTTTSYSISGTGTNACVPNPVVATISVNITPTVTLNSGSVCAGSVFTFMPSGANTYTITGNTYTVNPSVTSTYSVTGSSTAGCVSDITMATVTVNPIPFIAVNNGAVCPGNTFTLMPSGASSYTYSGGTDVVAPTITTSYSITGSSAQGCMASNTAVATVSVVNSLSVTVAGNMDLCSGQSTTLTASGASTYTWNTSAASGTIVLTPNVTGSYTVTGASGTCSNVAVVTISVSPIPTVGANSGSICAGNLFTIVPTGATSYTISGGSATVSPTLTTSYSVTGSSGPGCMSTNTAISTVVVNPLPVVTASSSNSIICFGEHAVLAAFGATNYVWSDAQTGASVTVSPPVTETYTVTGTSAAGCVNTATLVQRVDNCTGISQVSSSIIFGLYPNPNNGQFIIETAGNVNITIVNTLGETVYSGTTDGGKTPISISQLANGIYFVKASDRSQQHIVRIVKE